MSPPNESVDVAIIGAGPCGLAAGAALREAGISTVLFDRASITSSIVGYPTYVTLFSTPEKLEIGGVPFVCAGPKPTRHEALKYYRRVAERFELDIRQYEEVVALDGGGQEFQVRSVRLGGHPRVTQSRAVVFAIGCFHEPNLLDVPGEHLPHVTHAFREGSPYFDQDVLVIGGGNSACEASLDLYRAGARVTLVHHGDGFDGGVKPWVVSDAENRIEEGAIEAIWNTRVAEIGPEWVEVRPAHPPGGANGARANSDAAGSVTGGRRIDATWIFALTGWRPDFGFLRAQGVEVDAATGVPSHDPTTMETSRTGTFVAGVVTAGIDANRVFIENGRDHGELIARALSERWSSAEAPTTRPSGEAGTARTLATDPDT